MYPLRLNLLSPEKKISLKRITRFQFAKNTCELWLIIASIIGMSFLGSQLVLQTYFGSLMENVVQINERHAEEIRSIMRINKSLEKITAIQKEYFPWTSSLQTIVSAVPEGIVLHTLSIHSNTHDVYMSGIALTRENLISFHENLKKTGILKNIETPLSELTKPENISFTITATCSQQETQNL